MTTKKLNEKKLIQVKNINGCTNFGGIDLVGSKMFTVKTKSTNKLSYVSVYKTTRRQQGRTISSLTVWVTQTAWHTHQGICTWLRSTSG